MSGYVSRSSGACGPAIPNLRAALPAPHGAARAAAELEAAQSVGYISDKPVRLQRAYPLAAVVGMDHIKQALLLGAVDTGIGGIAISGRRGTAKSVMARGVHALMPPIEVVEGSFCNADPENPAEWEVRRQAGTGPGLRLRCVVQPVLQCPASRTPSLAWLSIRIPKLTCLPTISAGWPGREAGRRRDQDAGARRAVCADPAGRDRGPAGGHGRHRGLHEGGGAGRGDERVRVCACWLGAAAQKGRPSPALPASPVPHVPSTWLSVPAGGQAGVPAWAAGGGAPRHSLRR